MTSLTDRALAVGLFVLAFVTGQALIANAMGLTYDEPVYQAVSQRHLHWWGQALRGDGQAWSHAGLERGWGNSGNTPVTADWHPPLGKELLAVGRALPNPFGPFAQLRAGASLSWALLVTVLFLWIGAAAGRLAGLMAALAALTWPALAGHGNLAALDGPVTCVATLALWQAWRVLRQPTRHGGILFGVALGAAMATKFNGLMVAPAVLLTAALWRREALRPLALGACLVAPATFVLSWPWLWYSGLTHLGQVIAFHGRHGLIATEYFGRVYVDPPPPWHYPFVMLAITAPPLTLIGAVAGALARPAGDEARDRALLVRLLLLAAACHLLPFAAPHAAKYNGVRLFLPALVPLAALCGLGVAVLADSLGRALKPEQRWIGVALAALTIYLPALRGLLEVNPFPLAYYSAVVGDSAGADRRGFETSFWGEPFRGLAEWLNAKAPQGAKVYIHPPGALSMVQMYPLRTDLKLVSGAAAVAEADLFVYQNRRSEWDDLGRKLAASGEPAFVLTAGDAPVGFVWKAPGARR